MTLSKPLALAALALLGACARPDGAEQSLASSSAMLTASRLTPMLENGALDRVDHHLLLTLRLAPSETAVLDAREVDFPLPRERAPDPESWRVLVEDKAGRPLYLAQQKAPSGVRGEFAKQDGTIDETHSFTPGSPTLAVRLPVLRGAALLRVFGPASTLSPEDPRAKGVRPEAMVELGKVTLPQPERK